MNAEKRIKKTNQTRTFLIVSLSLSILGNIILINRKPEVNTKTKYITKELAPLIDTRVMLDKELEAATSELAKYKGISDKLDSLVNEANGKIKEQQRKISELTKNTKDSKKLVEELTIEMDKLKKLKDEYLEKIDNLLLLNEKLKSQNLSLNKTIKSLQNEVKTLKGKINIGEQLLADNISVSPMKKNLMGKYTRTAMAKKTQKINVCFDVLENKLAKSNKYKVFLRIFSPEGVVIFDKESGSGNTNNPELNVQMMYTIDEEFNYENKKQNLCIEWNAPGKYKSGTYIAELYSEKNKMGIASFSLR